MKTTEEIAKMLLGPKGVNLEKMGDKFTTDIQSMSVILFAAQLMAEKMYMEEQDKLFNNLSEEKRNGVTKEVFNKVIKMNFAEVVASEIAAVLAILDDPSLITKIVNAEGKKFGLDAKNVSKEEYEEYMNNYESNSSIDPNKMN